MTRKAEYINPQLYDEVRKKIAVYAAKGGASKDTVYSYTHSLNVYGKYLGRPVTLSDLLNINTETLKDWVYWLRQEYCLHKNSVARHVSAIKTLLALYGIDEKIDWDSITVAYERKLDYIILSEEEVQEIIRAGFRISEMAGLMLWVGYEAALRASELCNLKVKQFSPVRKAILKHSQKHGITIEIPITNDLVIALEKWIEKHMLMPPNLMFWRTRGGKWDRSSFAKEIYNPAVDMTGIPKKYGRRPRYHEFARHSRACNLLRNGVNIYYVSKLLGHSTVKTTEVYLHLVSAHDLADIKEKTHLTI